MEIHQPSDVDFSIKKQEINQWIMEQMGVLKMGYTHLYPKANNCSRDKWWFTTGFSGIYIHIDVLFQPQPKKISGPQKTYQDLWDFCTQKSWLNCPIEVAFVVCSWGYPAKILWRYWIFKSKGAEIGRDIQSYWFIGSVPTLILDVAVCPF